MRRTATLRNSSGRTSQKPDKAKFAFWDFSEVELRLYGVLGSSVFVATRPDGTSNSSIRWCSEIGFRATSIYCKLGASSRKEAVDEAPHRGLI
jgi:hypothetical protein